MPLITLPDQLIKASLAVLLMIFIELAESTGFNTSNRILMEAHACEQAII